MTTIIMDILNDEVETDNEVEKVEVEILPPEPRLQLVASSPQEYTPELFYRLQILLEEGQE